MGNASGQVMRADAYVDLAGLTDSAAAADLGTEGVHYQRTRFRYDDGGRLSQTTDAAGTVTKRTFDGRGRLVATAVGIDPADLATTALYEYDHGGVGDGNLTRVTQKPGGGTTRPPPRGRRVPSWTRRAGRRPTSLPTR